MNFIKIIFSSNLACTACIYVKIDNIYFKTKIIAYKALLTKHMEIHRCLCSGTVMTAISVYPIKPTFFTVICSLALLAKVIKSYYSMVFIFVLCWYSKFLCPVCFLSVTTCPWFLAIYFLSSQTLEKHYKSRLTRHLLHLERELKHN